MGRKSRQYNYIPVLKCSCTGMNFCPCRLDQLLDHWPVGYSQSLVYIIFSLTQNLQKYRIKIYINDLYKSGIRSSNHFLTLIVLGIILNLKAAILLCNSARICKLYRLSICNPSSNTVSILDNIMESNENENKFCKY